MMKMIAMLGAVALSVGAIGAAPADAQRYGYDGHRGGPGWNGGGYRGYRDGYRHQGYRGHRGYGRSRVVCRIHRGYYGPVRRCVRVIR